MRKYLLVIMATSTALSGCAKGVPGLRPLTYQEPADTRLIVSYADCPNTPKEGPNLAPVLAAVALGAASKLLEGFGNALTKGAEGGKLPASVATQNIELEAGETPRCLIAIRGRFNKLSAAENALTLPVPPPAVVVEGQPAPLPLLIRNAKGLKAPAGFPSVYELQHYVELQLITSRNKSALTFAPVMTKIERSMDGQRSGSRELSVAVKFERPGKDPTGGAVLISDHQIGQSRRYDDLTSGRFEKEAPWFGGIHSSSAAKTAQAGQAGAGATTAGGGAAAAQAASPAATAAAAGAATSAPAADPQSAGPFPFTVTATVVESRPTREFVAFVASVFAAAKPAIETELKGEIDPATIRTATSAGLEAEGVLAESLGKAHSAVLQYCAIAATDDKKAERFAKSGEARKAQISANKAALAADVSAPFSSLVVVSGEAPGVANPSLC